MSSFRVSQTTSAEIVSTLPCDRCNEDTVVLDFEGSNGEYQGISLCLNCIQEMFKVYQRAITEYQNRNNKRLTS